jgi:hypothetical protein
LNVLCKKGVLYHVGKHHFSSAPILNVCLLLNNIGVCDKLYSTLQSFTIKIACCVDRLNSQPLAVSFSDGSTGQCHFKNKRGAWPSRIPSSNVMIRRSDDALIYDCSTEDGREVVGSIRSEMEGGKLAASVIFWDLGITDAITDKHRTYQGNIVIPVLPQEASAPPQAPTDG